MTTALAATPDPVLRFVMTETKNPHPTDGDYVREWYMARLGPTTTALLQMLARIGAAFPPGQVVTVPAVDVASKLGVGFKGGTNSPLNKALTRLVKFSDVEYRIDGALIVPTTMRPITNYDLNRMTPSEP